MGRTRIRGKIATRLRKITDLKNEINELVKQDYELSDKEQWYKEEEVTKGRGKTKRTVLIGYVCWTEYFVDEDSGDKVAIERKYAVKQDGKWIDGVIENAV